MLKTSISGKRYLVTNAIPTCNIDFINDSSTISSVLEEDTMHSSTGNNIALDLSYSSEIQPLDLSCSLNFEIG